MKKYLLIFCFIGILIAQEQDEGLALSPVVTYWKTLTMEEKETFLFSYLVQVYETHTELKKEIGMAVSQSGITIIELSLFMAFLIT